MNVAFYGGRVGAKLLSLGYALLAGQADDAVMNLGGDRRSEQSKLRLKTEKSGVVSASK